MTPNPKLNKTEYKAAIDALMNESRPFIVVEYRGHKAETIKYTHPKSGKAMSFSRLVVNVESRAPSADHITVNLPLPEGFVEREGKCFEEAVPLNQWQPGCQKGDFILVLVDKVEKQMGATNISGSKFYNLDK